MYSALLFSLARIFAGAKVIVISHSHLTILLEYGVAATLAAWFIISGLHLHLGGPAAQVAYWQYPN